MCCQNCNPPYLQYFYNMFKEILVALLLACSTAWWSGGHMLTAAIAQLKLQQLDPNTFVKFQDLVASVNALCDNRSQTMIQAASWPDDIKEAGSGMTLWNDFHFIDTPYVYDSVIPVINYTLLGSNSVYVAEFAKKVLANNVNKNTAERALLARYLLHLVGDIHQPLHSVALFNKTYPKGDIGGNIEKIVLPNGTAFNFHSYWDSGALYFDNDTYVITRPLNDQNLSLVMQRAQDWLDQYEPLLAELGKITDPAYWAGESLEIAKNTTYPWILKSNQATSQYRELVFETSKQRVVMGGLRLANTILEVYGNPQKYEREDLKGIHDQRMKYLLERVEEELVEL